MEKSRTNNAESHSPFCKQALKRSHIFGAIAPSTQAKGAALGRNYTQNPLTNPVPVSPYRGALRGANGRFGPMGISEEAKEKERTPKEKRRQKWLSASSLSLHGS